VDADGPASVLTDLLPRFFRSTCCWRCYSTTAT
jgi:hypothetical protein